MEDAQRPALDGADAADSTRTEAAAFVSILDADGRVKECHVPHLRAAERGCPLGYALRAGDEMWTCTRCGGDPLWETPRWAESRVEQRRLWRAVGEAAGGATVRHTGALVLADAGPIIVDSYVIPLHGEHGAISGFAVAGTEKTHPGLPDGVAMHAPVGFAQLDTALRYVRINDQLAAMEGLEVHECVGRTPLELTSDLPSEEYLPYLEAALGGEGGEFEVEASTRTGERRTLSGRVYPLRDAGGEVSGMGLLLIDVTTHRAAASERERALNVLRTALLPAEPPRVDGFDVSTRYTPATGAAEVSGDFYEVLSGPDFGTAALIGDVCGHGADAAALTSLARYTLVPLIERFPESPAASLRELNRIILQHHARSFPEFVTIALVFLRRSRGGFMARIALAGHPSPLLVRARGGAAFVGAHGTLIGVRDELRIPEVAFRLEEGDALVLYTDGYIEARDPDGEAFGEDRLASAAAGAAGRSQEQIADAVDDAVAAFCGSADPGRDDRALVVLRVDDA